MKKSRIFQKQWDLIFLQLRPDLDESLKQFTTVYPAAGNDHSAVKLTIPELEQVAEANGWVDVCKETEN